MDIPPGLIDTAAILRTGATTDALHRAFRAGQLVRIRRGFYVPTEDWLRTRSYPLRYRLGAVPEPVRSGEFLCSGLTRTTVDVLASEELDQALVVADGAARRLSGAGILGPGAGLLAVPAIAAGIGELPSAAGRRRAERVADLASPLPESVGESYSRAVFEFLGFEQPVLQHVFSDGAGFIGRSDFWWPRQGVVGEFDGKGKYVEAAQRDGITAEEAVYREKLREDRIRALGHGFVRWRWADLADPSKLRRKLLAAGIHPGAGTPDVTSQRLVRGSGS